MLMKVKKFLPLLIMSWMTISTLNPVDNHVQIEEPHSHHHLEATTAVDYQVYMSSNTSVTQGSTYTAYVYLTSLSDISSLNVSVYFDSNVLSVSSTYNQVSASLYDSVIKEDCLSYTYLFSGTQEDTNVRLFYFYYKVNSDATVGSSYFDIVIDEAYDNSLNSKEISGSRYSFTVNEKVQQKTCRINSSSSISTKISQEFELTYRFNTYEIAAGSVHIQYDSELFEFVSSTDGAFLTDKAVDINSSMTGCIYVSFSGTEYSTSTAFLTVKFKTIQNVATTSSIKCVVPELYDLDLNSITCNTYTTNVSVLYDDTYTLDAVEMKVNAFFDEANNQLLLSVNLAENSCLGAGDFTLTWPTQYYDYVSYTKGFSPSFFNVNDKLTAEGTLKFSIISLEDITSSETVISVLLDIKNPHDDTTTDLTLSATGLTDSLTNPIQLNLIDATYVVSGVCTFGDWTVTKEATCTEAGQEKRTCSVCGKEETREISAKGHTWDTEWTIDVEPTCTSEGSKSHHCLDCDAKTDITVIEKTAHTAGQAVVENKVDETCTTDGSYDEVVYCQDCGAELSREHKTTTAHGHSYGEWTVVKAATCTEEGQEKRTCSICGNEETRSIAAKGHTWDTEWTIDVAATCTSEGSKSHHCLDCDAKTDVTIIEKTAHTGGEAVIENKVEPTCTTDGSYDEVVYCLDCGTELSRVKHTIVATGHSYGEWQVVKAATCTESGQEKRICATCGNEEYRTIEATGHDWDTEWTIDVEPTCTNEGSKSHHCRDCDEKTDITVVEKTAHTAGETVIENKVDSTCTTAGSYDEVTYCTDCGTEMSRIHHSTDAHGHSYGEWIVVNAATCTEEGQEKRVCSICGNEEVRSIEAKGHNWDTEWTIDVAPTCTSEGSKSHHCKDCDAKTDITVIEKTEHTAGESVIENKVEATCTTDGSYDEVVYCQDCGAEISRITHTIEATGHSYGDWTEVKAPTCTDAGEEKRVCSDCGYVETREISPKGHNWDTEWTIDVEPTCTSEGSKSHHCKDCDAKTDVTVIEKTEHNPGTAVRENEVDPTCDSDGSYDEVIYCQDCGAEISRTKHTIEATGHSYGDWTEVVAPTYESEGREERTCSKCGHTESRTIDKLDATDEFIEVVNSIDVDNDSLEELYEKINKALSLYKDIEDKTSVSEYYQKLCQYMESYNNLVSGVNEAHEENEKVAVGLLFGAVALTSAALLVILEKLKKGGLRRRRNNS